MKEKENTQVAQGSGAKKVQMVPLDKISPNPLNPRKNLGDISELAASIKKVGILQNLTIIKDSKKEKEELISKLNKQSKMEEEIEKLKKQNEELMKK